MTEQMTPLRRRMIDDMAIRNMSPNTQRAAADAADNWGQWSPNGEEHSTAMEQTVTNEEDPSGTMSEHFRAGIEDVVILPMVAIALVVKKVLRSAWTILKHIIDFLFPILLQLMRFPLFTLRILGDGISRT